MIQKIVTKLSLNDAALRNDDLTFWLGKSPEERVAAIDYLRRQYHGTTKRLQRSARVIERTQG